MDFDCKSHGGGRVDAADVVMKMVMKMTINEVTLSFTVDRCL